MFFNLSSSLNNLYFDKESKLWKGNFELYDESYFYEIHYRSFLFFTNYFEKVESSLNKKLNKHLEATGTSKQIFDFISLLKELNISKNIKISDAKQISVCGVVYFTFNINDYPIKFKTTLENKKPKNLSARFQYQSNYYEFFPEKLEGFVSNSVSNEISNLFFNDPKLRVRFLFK